MRVFCDTNVLAAGIVGRGLCAELVARLLERHAIVVSPQVFLELERVLPRMGLDATTTRAAVRLFRARAELVEPSARPKRRVRDHDDDAILDAAIGCAALVTGDKALLAVKEPPVPIVTPRALWTLLDRDEHGTTRTGNP